MKRRGVRLSRFVDDEEILEEDEEEEEYDNLKNSRKNDFNLFEFVPGVLLLLCYFVILTNYVSKPVPIVVSIETELEESITEEIVEPEVEIKDVYHGKYYGSVTSTKFHVDSCHWTDKILSDNLIVFASTDEAILEGYEPCGTCKPE